MRKKERDLKSPNAIKLLTTLDLITHKKNTACIAQAIIRNNKIYPYEFSNLG